MLKRVESGRHPMVSPVRVIRMVHAVKTPLKPPTGKLAADRRSGETVAVIRPATDPLGVTDPLLGIDPPSTAQVELSAEWVETTDEKSMRVPSRPVQVAALEVDAVGLPPLRHEFGDTRRRTITYTVTALSRFRQFFDPGPPASSSRSVPGHRPLRLVPRLATRWMTPSSAPRRSSPR